MRAAVYLERLEEASDAPFHVGREKYEWMLSNVHLLDLDSDELLGIGREVLAETKEKLAEVAREIDTERGWLDVLEELKLDHPSGDDLRETYDSEMKRARDFVRAYDLVTIPENETLDVVDTPVFFRAILPYAAYSSACPF